MGILECDNMLYRAIAVVITTGHRGGREEGGKGRFETHIKESDTDPSTAVFGCQDYPLQRTVLTRIP